MLEGGLVLFTTNMLDKCNGEEMGESLLIPTLYLHYIKRESMLIPTLCSGSLHR